MDRTVFNKAQLEMLDIMAGIRSEEELDKLWQSGEWSEQTLKELGEAHYRTPYKS